MMTTTPGSPLPHGFVVPPNDVVNDDAADPTQSPDQEDDDAARAEALGYTDPEDAPTSSSRAVGESSPHHAEQLDELQSPDDDQADPLPSEDHSRDDEGPLPSLDEPGVGDGDDGPSARKPRDRDEPPL